MKKIQKNSTQELKREAVLLTQTKGHERTPDVRITECPKPTGPSVLIALQLCA